MTPAQIKMLRDLGTPVAGELLRDLCDTALSAPRWIRSDIAQIPNGIAQCVQHDAKLIYTRDRTDTWSYLLLPPRTAT